MDTANALGSSVGPIQLFLAAAGAAVGNIDVIGQDTHTDERRVSQHLEVDVPLVAFSVEIVGDLIFVDLKEDLLNIIVGLEAAAADGRADSGNDVLGLGAVFFAHLLDGLGKDSIGNAAPSGMDCSNGMILLIIEQDQLAVGIETGQNNTGNIGDQRITAIGCAHLTEAAFTLTDNTDGVGVQLAGTNNVFIFTADLLGSDGIITGDILFVVTAGITEVEAIKDALGHAALTGEKGMADMGADGKLGGYEIGSALFKGSFKQFRHGFYFLLLKIDVLGADAAAALVEREQCALHDRIDIGIFISYIGFAQKHVD